MTRDPLIEYASGRWTGAIVRGLGLPTPHALKRAEGAYRADELKGRLAVVGAFENGPAGDVVKRILQRLGATVQTGPSTGRIDVATFDATACRDVDSLSALRSFFGPLIIRLAPCARLVVVAAVPAECAHPQECAAASAIDGFVRSLAKEVGRNGSTVNLLQVSRSATDRLDGPLRFFCSARSAYVSGQAVVVSTQVRHPNVPVEGSPRLKGKLALVTGAARGLGAATALRLAEEGARVLCIDLPSATDSLEALAKDIGGLTLEVDLTAADAPSRIVDCVRSNGSTIEVLVHNAGITRDRTLMKMTDAEWASVMAVNLKAVMAIDGAIDAGNLLHDDAREIYLSSISGIAGNRGQSTYAASKAALIGYASARAERFAARGITVNCVAPGFIETEMTKRIPVLIREAGRRMNALSQGGQPRDVAEMITFLALPEAAGVTGQTLRVCGQALLGA